MVSATSLQNDIQQTIQEIGNQIRVKYYSMTDSGSYYDDSYKLSNASGTDVWTSGAQQPLKAASNSYEARLLEQGKLTSNDSVLYVLGTLATSGAAIKIGTGSPVTKEYSLIDDGVKVWQVGDTIVYKKLYMRYLPIGSLAKE